ncbi:TraC family protein [Sinorhizobium sp. BJ1]|uniref:TraC family protein n=1 Tax=Sinorhizobium sp. BJ1 TaxID=2035455 RepID=UPI000BE8E4FC|nr:TraC family protein [Sinorhizobium sp. BJ1]PDT82351.1 pilus assembly protein [Sinorhizobium sp. BJ1]
MGAKSSLSDLDAQIEKLRERRRLLIVKSAERFARAATKSGLAEMEIPDEEVDRILEEIAARFRKEEKKGTAGATASPRRQPSGVSGTPAEVSHDG